VIVLVVLAAPTTFSQTSKQELNVGIIPLDRIWATTMPGTRNIEKLAKQHLKLTKDDLWNPLIDSFFDPQWQPKKGKQARRVFAVQGEDLRALREAHAVLTGERKPSGAVPSSEAVTLVFFSQPRGTEVQLVKVQRHGFVVEIQYRIAPFTEAHLTMDLALIPLGKIPPGKYEVKITNAPAVVRIGSNVYKPLLPQQLDTSAEIYVSRPTSFDVVEK
jgi:hypothetical protein